MASYKVVDRKFLLDQYKAYDQFAFYVDKVTNYYAMCALQDGSEGLKVVTTVSDPDTEIELASVNTQTTPVDLTGLVGDGTEYIEAKTLTTKVPKYYTQTEIDSMINALNTFEVALADALPSVEDAKKVKSRTMWMVTEYDKDGNPTGNRVEYLLINGAFEMVGTTSVDLTDYVKKEEIYIFTDAGYDASTAGTTGAKVIVADGAMTDPDTEIELASVTPVINSFVPAVGDYTIYVAATQTSEYKFLKRDEVATTTDNIDFENWT